MKIQELKQAGCETNCTSSSECFDIRLHELPPLTSDLAERYVFLISELAPENGNVRPLELTKRLGVNPATVTRNLRRLEEQGLVHVESQRWVKLTENGIQLAEAMKFRQEILARFLLAYGVKPCTAQQDAVRLMANISTESIKVFANLLADRLSFKESSNCRVSSCSCHTGDCLQKRLRDSEV